jgi:hypothetical protein
MTFMEAAAKAKAENRAFYREAWRKGHPEKTRRIGLMFGRYKRAWIANRRNLSIGIQEVTGFEFGEMLTAFDSTCFSYSILNLGYEDLIATDYEIESVTIPSSR